jgi:hypothetical protein
MTVHSDVVDSDLHESELVRFVIAAKQGRYLGQLKSRKNRGKFLKALYHFHDWDPDVVIELPRGCTAKDLVELLYAKGAGPRAWLVSASPRLDASVLPLDEAISNVFGVAEGTVVSCVPGALAYFEGEDERLVLATPPHGRRR